MRITDQMYWQEAVQESSLTMAQKAVAWAILKVIDRSTGSGYSGYDSMQRRASCSRRTAIDAVRVLEEKGWIEVATGTGRGNANDYWICVPQGYPAKRPKTPDERVRVYGKGAGDAPIIDSKSAGVAPFEAVKGATDDIKGATDARNDSIKGAGDAPPQPRASTAPSSALEPAALNSPEDAPAEQGRAGDGYAMQRPRNTSDSDWCGFQEFMHDLGERMYLEDALKFVEHWPEYTASHKLVKWMATVNASNRRHQAFEIIVRKKFDKEASTYASSRSVLASIGYRLKPIYDAVLADQEAAA